MDQSTGKRIALGAAALALALVLGVRGGSMVQAIAQSRAARTLVIDAGHGGFDGGAVGSNGTTEQDINLSIAQRVQSLAAFFGVRTAMTRTDENALDYDPSRPVRENKIADIKAREQLVQDTADPVFLSIHLNKFSDAQYHGAQVFYSPGHADSKTLAELLQAALAEGCDPANTRQAKQADDLPDEAAGMPGCDRRMRLPVQPGGGAAAERHGISQKTRRQHRDRLSPV